MINRKEEEDRLMERFRKKYRNVPPLIIKDIVVSTFGIGQQSIMDEYRDNQLELFKDLRLSSIAKILNKKEVADKL